MTVISAIARFRKTVQSSTSKNQNHVFYHTPTPVPGIEKPELAKVVRQFIEANRAPTEVEKGLEPFLM